MLDQKEPSSDNQVSESDKNGFWKNSPIYFDQQGMKDFAGKVLAIVVGLAILAIASYIAIKYIVSAFE